MIAQVPVKAWPTRLSFSHCRSPFVAPLSPPQGLAHWAQHNSQVAASAFETPGRMAPRKSCTPHLSHAPKAPRPCRGRLLLALLSGASEVPSQLRLNPSSERPVKRARYPRAGKGTKEHEQGVCATTLTFPTGVAVCTWWRLLWKRPIMCLSARVCVCVGGFCSKLRLLRLRSFCSSSCSCHRYS